MVTFAQNLRFEERGLKKAKKGGMHDALYMPGGQ
jgi:hypothetical protein